MSDREQWIAEAMRLADRYRATWMDPDWRDHREALRAHLSTVPDGWVLVPVEPTKEMLEAAEDQFVPAYTGTPVAEPSDIYRAMIAAAPKQENQP